jgi:predicted ABC-type ATPase
MKKRMRVFAGPNGSGKSTLVDQFVNEKSSLINLDRHINPDSIDLNNVLDFGKFGLLVDEDDFREFITHSSLYEKSNIDIEDIRITNNCFNIPLRNSYLSSILAEYLRHCYLNSREQLFSYETVFSHSQKVKFLKTAKDCKWRIYLYFVSTENTDINHRRVRERVLKGGHDVPHDKIIKRYTKSLDNLFPALQYCRRVYIFDNSTHMELIDEKMPNNSLVVYNEDAIPLWVDKYVLSKFN